MLLYVHFCSEHHRKWACICLSIFFHTGVPALVGQLKLEITISFNTLIFSFGHSTSSETTDHLTTTLVRGTSLRLYMNSTCALYY